MDINWFTVIAQVINFLILVWLLKKFLYKPILNAVNEREKKITDELKDADTQKANAQKEKDDFKKMNEDFDSKKEALFDKAVSDANAQKQQLITNAKADAKALGATMEKAFKEQQKQDKTALAHNAREQVFSITRKALTDIASIDIELQSIATFIKHLKASKGEDKKQFISAFTKNLKPILVRTAFDFPKKQQVEFTDLIRELLDPKTTLQFKIAPELINGIELSTSDYKMAWSFSEYLSAFEKTISLEIKKKVTPNPYKKEHAST